MGLLQNARHSRISDITAALDAAKKAGKIIDAKKFIIEIMAKYLVCRKTALEYYSVANARFNGDSIL